MEKNKQLQAGDHVPDVIFKTRVGDGPVCGDSSGTWQDVTTEEIFAGKKIIVFALPGAFTPTCSSTHLPGYESHSETFKELGIDDVFCLSVNAAFVMDKWVRELRSKTVKLLPDGNADFTRGMGMLVSKRNLGFGERSWRYSMLVNDGVIEKMFIEDGFMDECPTDPFEVSGADTMLSYLREQN